MRTIAVWSLAERQIADAMLTVEKMGVDVCLTDAVILLGEARAKVEEFVTGEKPLMPVRAPVNAEGMRALRLLAMALRKLLTPEEVAALRERIDPGAPLREFITFLSGERP